MKSNITLHGDPIEIEFEVVTLLEDPSIAWTCKKDEYFIRVTSPGKYCNQVWHSHLLPKETINKLNGWDAFWKMRCEWFATT